MTLTRATLSSDNSVYAQLILDIGPDAVCQTAKRLGIQTKLDCYPAEGLGGLTRGVTTLEMAGAYATLASGGVRHRPTGIEKVVFPDGKSEKLAKPKGTRVMTDGQAYEVTQILEQNVQSGTGTAASYGCPAAGKTGTTDEAKDAWFVGYTPELSAAVWVGYPDAGVAMPGAQGGTYAAPVWNAFMTPAHGEFCGSFPTPTEPFAVVAVLRQVRQHGRGRHRQLLRLRRRQRIHRGSRLQLGYRRHRGHLRGRWPVRPGSLRVGAPAAAGGPDASRVHSGPRNGWHRRHRVVLPELELIAAIQAALGRRSERIVRWTGDDAAVVRARPLAVTSIDTVVEGTHFRLDTHSPADVGWKALAAALSDLAAMGAEPGRGLHLAGAARALRGRARAGGRDGIAGSRVRHDDRRRGHRRGDRCSW